MLEATGSKLNGCSSPWHKSKLGAAIQWQDEQEASFSISEFLGEHPQSWQLLGAGCPSPLFHLRHESHNACVIQQEKWVPSTSDMAPPALHTCSAHLLHPLSAVLMLDKTSHGVKMWGSFPEGSERADKESCFCHRTGFCYSLVFQHGQALNFYAIQ